MAVLKYKSGGTWYDLTVGMDQGAADARYVKKTGDTMSGALTTTTISIANDGEGIRSAPAGLGLFMYQGTFFMTDNIWSGTGKPLIVGLVQAPDIQLLKSGGSPRVILTQSGVVGASIRPETHSGFAGVTILDEGASAYANIAYRNAYPQSARVGKAAIIDLHGCMDKVRRLRPIEYTEKGALGEHQRLRKPGLMADEVVNVLPGSVAKDPKGTPAGLDYASLVPVLIGAVQELEARVTALEAAA